MSIMMTTLSGCCRFEIDLVVHRWGHRYRLTLLLVYLILIFYFLQLILAVFFLQYELLEMALLILDFSIEILVQVTLLLVSHNLVMLIVHGAKLLLETCIESLEVGADIGLIHAPILCEVVR